MDRMKNIESKLINGNIDNQNPIFDLKNSTMIKIDLGEDTIKTIFTIFIVIIIAIKLYCGGCKCLTECMKATRTKMRKTETSAAVPNIPKQYMDMQIIQHEPDKHIVSASPVMATRHSSSDKTISESPQQSEIRPTHQSCGKTSRQRHHLIMLSYAETQMRRGIPQLFEIDRCISFRTSIRSADLELYKGGSVVHI